MSGLTLLPERRENPITRVWTELTENVPVHRLVGVLCLALATTIVASGLVPAALLPGPIPLGLYLASLFTALLVGSWMTIFPERSREVFVAALLAAPVVWTTMLFTWDDGGRLISPIALLYTGAVAAAFCGRRVLIAQIVFDVVAVGFWVDLRTDALELILPRIIAHLTAVALFTVVVYVIRRRAERVREEFRSRSVIDPLTGLPNRRHVEAVAAQTVASARRLEREVFSLVVDIDRLKEINAVHGPAVGDEVITRVSSLVRSTLRPEDLLARVGGEELLALGLVRSQFEAVRVAERLRRAVRNAGLPMQVTCSVGVATAVPGGGTDPIEWVWNLTSVAEESMAAAKASGRDRVVAARQSGDVLGNALGLITARASSSGQPVAEASAPQPRWTTPEGTARLLAGTGLFGVLQVAWFLAVSQIGGLPRSVSSLIVAAATSILLACSVATLVRPRLGQMVFPVTIFTADVLWAALAWLDAYRDGFSSPMLVSIMSAWAAWLIRPWLLGVQLVVTYPLMWVVLRAGGAGAQAAAIDALIHGTAVGIAAFGLFLLRRHGEYLIAQSAAMSTTDQLTGLPNRRYLQERAAAIVAGAARLGVPVRAVMVDVDEFWQVNDQFGYAVGDHALIDVGRAVLRVLRPEDTLVRIGGDELVIVALGDHSEAKRTGERVSSAVATVFAGDELQLTCSIGVAAAVPPSRTDPVGWIMELIAAAAEDLRVDAESRGAEVENQPLSQSAQ